MNTRTNSCKNCARTPYGICRDCDRQYRAERLHAVMMHSLYGNWPGPKYPHLAFSRLPDYAQCGWLDVAEAARDMPR